MSTGWSLYAGRGWIMGTTQVVGTTTKSSHGAAPRPKSGARAPSPGPFTESSPKDYNIAAVDRSLDLLEALARLGPASLAALAEAAGCTRTAAFRLLRTLQSRGFAIQDEARGLWRLGARWSVLGRAASEQGALAATAMPLLSALGKATGENVYLRVREGMEIETVAIYQADAAIRMYSEVGKRGPLHAGCGRILLAFAPEAVQTQLLAQRLNRYTPATRIDPTWIAADLQRIRTRGYLITADEVVAGAVGIAAPVRDAVGAVIAVLHISAPSMRMRPPRPRALLPQVMAAAAQLSEALGAAGASLQDSLIQGEQTATGWKMAGGRINLARPHSIFR
jgi:IclR family transcriptional regulator, KDG regulon repressor